LFKLTFLVTKQYSKIAIRPQLRFFIWLPAGKLEDTLLEAHSGQTTVNKNVSKGAMKQHWRTTNTETA